MEENESDGNERIIYLITGMMMATVGITLSTVSSSESLFDHVPGLLLVLGGFLFFIASAVKSAEED
ncbi:MAG: hypothetical protein ABEJ02_04850 [Candidatus Paceibacteria bacterium]